MSLTLNESLYNLRTAIVKLVRITIREFRKDVFKLIRKK